MLVVLFASVQLLYAVDYPTKPVTIVVGFAAGGSQEVAARAMMEKFSKGLGVPVMILNKPGSTGLLAAEYVARSKPDGYTMFVLGTSLLMRQTIDPKMPVDILKDFEPVCSFVKTPMFIAVKGDSKFKTIEDLVEFTKRNPGKLSCGSSGIGSVGHYCVGLLKVSDIQVKFVPFTGEGVFVPALMGGHLDFAIATWGALAGKVASGDLRVLANFDEIRNPDVKDTPTLKEKGYTDSMISAYYSFVVPAGTPTEVIKKLDDAARPAIEDPEAVAKYKKIGFSKTYMGPSDLKQFFKSELEKYGKISKGAGITIE
jgi:tripartite-type tricarboxylate transporter receptor subunit TctC